jgi:hypothetical protein
MLCRNISFCISTRCSPETPGKYLPVSFLHDVNGIIASDVHITNFAGVIFHFPP